MLGIGRDAAVCFSRDDVGRLDAAALENALRKLDGKPGIIIGNAGEVNGGDFDPIAQMADLAKQYNCWLHIDGAFGLFAAVSPRTQHLVAGVDRADSVTVDGHKWLNVPYDCGFSFFRDPTLLARAFHYTADYLPDPDDPAPGLTQYAPEGSRRARSLPVWATLRAYGRQGVRDMIETHLDLAQRMAQRVDDAADLERLSDVPLNIVCFRYNPGNMDESTLDAINSRLGDLIISDGRYYAGTTRYKGKTALRPAIVNWRTTAKDIDGFVDVIRELGAVAVSRQA
jgi:glutamate/tyrosine decarboxylase-like PLP-dependent enzyme